MTALITISAVLTPLTPVLIQLNPSKNRQMVWWFTILVCSFIAGIFTLVYAFSWYSSPWHISLADQTTQLPNSTWRATIFFAIQAILFAAGGLTVMIDSVIARYLRPRNLSQPDITSPSHHAPTVPVAINSAPSSSQDKPPRILRLILLFASGVIVMTLIVILTNKLSAEATAFVLGSIIAGTFALLGTYLRQNR